MSTNPFQHSVRVAMACLLLLLAGCVTPPQVRVASGEVGAALTDLRAAGRDFEDAYIAELDAVQQLIVQAIVSGAVNRRIEALTGEAFDGDLLALSGTIAEERAAARRRVDQVRGRKPPASDAGEPDYEAFVSDILAASMTAGLRRTASVVRAHDPERADMLAAQAARIEADITAVVHPDELNALANLVRLETIKDTVRAGLADLDDYTRLLQLIHRQTNEWIRTDVVVEGDELAAFFENIAGLSGDGGAP